MGIITAELAEPAMVQTHRPAKRSLRYTVALFILTVVIIIGGRIWQPSDLYEKDQIKTIGYTADIVRNHNWLIPRDTLQQETTKPPLYNWIGAIAVMASHSSSEFIFKLPSLMAGMVVLGLIVWMTRRMALTMPFAGENHVASETGLLAAMFWLATYPVWQHIYLARPDMLLTAFITGAWVCGTLALESDKSTWKPAAGFWICLAGATLAKGPAALLPVIYVVIASRSIYGGFSTLRRLRWWWGILLTLALIGAWAVPALIRYRGHFYHVMIRGEIINRVLKGSPEDPHGIPWWQMPAWFLDHFKPWSALCILAILSTRGPIRKALSPAMLWMILGVAFFSFSAGKRYDYLAPVYPPAAALAACWLMSLLAPLQMTAYRVAIVPVLFAALMAMTQIQFSHTTLQPYAEHMKEFARECSPIIKKDRVMVLVKGYQPFLPLMGRGGNNPRQGQINRAQWLVCQKTEDWDAVVVSKDIGDVKQRNPLYIALYRMPPEPQRSRVRSLLRKIQAHNAVEERAEEARK